jgi:uncharacterized protein DUF5996
VLSVTTAPTGLQGEGFPVHRAFAYQGIDAAAVKLAVSTDGGGLVRVIAGPWRWTNGRQPAMTPCICGPRSSQDPHGSFAPLINHWWQVTLYVSPRGLTTGAVRYRNAVFDMEFDFLNHVLAVRHSDGRQEAVPLAARPVAEFYGQTLSALDHLGIETHIVGKPDETDPGIRFAEDYQHADYDSDAARTFWSNWFRPTGHDKLSGVHRKG